MVQDSTKARIRFSLLPEITQGSIFGDYEDRTISALILDSRKAVVSSGGLFFAIRGARHDGHQYIHALYDQGVRFFVVETLPEYQNYPGAGFLEVPSGVAALQAIAAYHRSAFDIPVIGITGSNGKTIIKEWLFQVLSRTEVVAKNPGSYNSQVGVPLSVWQIQPYHTIGIFEAGISTVGEMEKLEAIIKPSIGIFTNIGPAHNEGFPNRESKVNEKLKLFRNVRRLIYCADHQPIHSAVVQSGIPSFSWGFSASADLKLSKAGNTYTLTSKETSFELELPFQDAASVENCFHVVSTLLHLGVSPETIQKDVRSLKSVPMRLELKDGINQCQIIDDSYNNDLAGLEISLQFLSNQVQKKKKTVILSDIHESGLEPHELVRNIAALIRESHIDRIIGIGPALYEHKDAFATGTDSRFFQHTEAFLEQLKPDDFGNEVILVKGARVFGFEKITSKLQRKIHGTVMEIDLGALVNNFNAAKSRLHKTTRVMVMVKAFAYGSGSNEIASLLQYHRADYLGVAYPDEGVDLRKSNISLPIMVMNAAEESFEQLLAYRLEPEVYSFRFLRSLITFLDGRKCRVHVKLDTGMRRLGFEPHQVDELIRVLAANPNIEVVSIFTHLAAADEASQDAFSERQATLFRDGAERIARAIGYKPLFHILNSSGILRFPELQFDMVRLGIGLYGVDPTAMSGTDLRPVATLKTIVSQIKHIPAGETIGYGRRGVAKHDMAIATIAIGYADGFSRAFSRGKGKVLINGALAPVVGNVCMDMTMVDVTGLEVAEGDEVIIFGRDLPIQHVADWIGTIPYEILTSTSERIKRVFVAESL